MPWPSLKTWTASIVTVLDLNTEIRDRMALLKTSIADDGTIAAAGSNTITGSLTMPTTAPAYLGDCLPIMRGYGERFQTLSISAGVVAIDLSGGNHIVVNMNANITSFTLTSSAFGLLTAEVLPFVLYLVGDGTLRTVTWTFNGSAARFSSGVVASLVGTSGHYTQVAVRYLNGLTVFADQIGYDS